MTRAPTRAPRILVVDDDFATRLIAGEALLASGFEVVEAEDGLLALDAFDIDPPDAILLDIHMPHLDGYQVCERIRQRPTGKTLAIMVTTASDDVVAVERAFAAGATDFMTKPINLALLPHRVRYMLRAAEIAAEARAGAARLAQAQALAHLVHWHVDADGEFAWASDPLAVFWPDGPNPREPGLALLELVHPADRARVAALLAERAAHEAEFRIVLPDGSERIVRQHATLGDPERGIALVGATQDVTEAKHAEQIVAQLAFYDDLTGIPNRQFVERYVAALDPTEPCWAIAIELGIAGLARLSTTVRDALVRAAVARVIERVRGDDLALRLDAVPRAIEDYTGSTLVARTSPDEVLVITRSPTTTARQIADALATPIVVGGQELVVRPRLGVAAYPEGASTLDKLHESARAAMQDAQPIAPRDIVMYSEALQSRRARIGRTVRELDRAIAAARLGPSELLAVSYEPRVDPRTHIPLGIRARATWVRDDHGIVEAIAGDPGLRARLAMWTFANALHDVATWRDAGRLAVEMSGQRLATRGADVVVHELLARSQLDPRVLDLELVDLPTGEAELDRVALVAHALRDAGVAMWLGEVDDRCSLRVLRSIPFAGLRVDYAALARAPNLARTLGRLASAFDMQLAVTGVDTPAALATLADHPIDELSGTTFRVPAANRGSTSVSYGPVMNVSVGSCDG